ncbi:hypothetical protein XELAEV_18038812mg [Xenopus laevis]|uniref:GIY-YIG domain-containing protein n=1 Tax=Xenopus laevis TaxID=8355 RepID=A0A974C6B5_XENLA|nr:hypothetical protein XELAEV_18038812mg [Xenopus laevis]
MKLRSNFVTKIYTKPTDHNQLLAYDSFHPPAVKKSIPISQFTRVCCITNEPSLQENDLTKMRSKLRGRGYPTDILDDSVATAKMRPGAGTHSLKKDGKKQNTQRITFVGQYHSQSEHFRQILCKHWYLLRDAYPTVTDFNQMPMMSFRKVSRLAPNNRTTGSARSACTKKRPVHVKRSGAAGVPAAPLDCQGKVFLLQKGCTLGKKLVHAEVAPSPRQNTFMGPPRDGMFQCRGCFQCKFVFTGDTFERMVAHKTYKIRGPFSCDTSFVVYMLVCLCNLIYVGETIQTIRDRFSQHC